MDKDHFDHLVQHLTTRSLHRRSALRVIAGGLLGSAIGVAVRADAAALCKTAGHRCDRDRECCSRDCRGGRCRRRAGGTCRATDLLCVQCNDEPTCSCLATDGGPFCGKIAVCVADCSSCFPGEECVAANFPCECSSVSTFACAVPCPRG